MSERGIYCYRLGVNTPAPNALVRFRVFNPSCIPGGTPLHDYRGQGRFLGECADGFMVRVVSCTKPENLGQVVFVRDLVDANALEIAP